MPKVAERGSRPQNESVHADIWDEAEVRFVQPYEARKMYICPGCNRDIPEGTFHLVAVPPEAADLRRHWHKSCWERRSSRRPRA